MAMQIHRPNVDVAPYRRLLTDKLLPQAALAGPDSWPIEYYAFVADKKLAFMAVNVCPLSYLVPARSDLRWNLLTAFNLTSETIPDDWDLAIRKPIEATTLSTHAQVALTHLAERLATSRMSAFHLRRHESLWVPKSTTNVLVSGFPQVGQCLSLAIYYVRTLFNGQWPPNSMQLNVGQSPQCASASCFALRPTRFIDFWLPILPQSVLEFDSFFEQLVRVLRHGCCVPSKDLSLVDAIVQSFLSIEAGDNRIHIAPSWDMPETTSVLLEGFHFSEHVLNIHIGDEQLLISRLDSIGEPLFVSGTGSTEIKQLRPRKVEAFEEGPCYLGTTKDSLRDAQLRGEKKVVHGQKRRPYRMPRWTVITIFLVIFLFHVILIRLVYQEYCAVPDLAPYRR